MNMSPVLAVAFGIVAVVLTSFAAWAVRDSGISVAVATAGVVYAAAGSLLVWLRPGETWAWALLIVAPMALILGVSMLFSGNLTNFWSHDVPVIAAALIGLCVGTVLAARLTTASPSRL